jgi:hypothetical protein
MNAQDLPLTQLLDGAKQFIVPIFQRDYSWGTKHCQQLWNDILRVGGDSNTRAHFLGSVVYIAAEDNAAAIPRWLVIDGQQRLTTVTLLLTALRDQLIAAPSEDETLPSPEEVEDRFLRNRHGKGERRSKLMLRRADNDALSALMSGQTPAADTAEVVRENYEFFRERLADSDVGRVYAGIAKLVIVDVSLTRGHDDPQMIFESLNSTGLDLTQADLIRNFVLMRLDDELQTRLYEDYWRPIELAFGNRYRSEFDKFCRDFLVLKLKPSKQLRADAIYHHFRGFFHAESAHRSVEDVLGELRRFAGYYVRFSLGRESDPLFAGAANRLRGLVEVASPLMLRLHDCHERTGQFDSAAFKEAIELLESYVFRRSACDMQTRNLYQVFASLAYRVRDNAPLLSLKVAIYRGGKKRRFPSNIEFSDALETRDVYAMRTCTYLLDRLENDSKEKIDTSSFTIEHVLPQNENLLPAWREMLGDDWKTIQETWLHRLGNLTLTGYNAEYSDRSFDEKKAMPKGFNDSPPAPQPVRPRTGTMDRCRNRGPRQGAGAAGRSCLAGAGGRYGGPFGRPIWKSGGPPPRSTASTRSASMPRAGRCSTPSARTFWRWAKTCLNFAARRVWFTASTTTSWRSCHARNTSSCWRTSTLMKRTIPRASRVMRRTSHSSPMPANPEM